ncbi:c-type cytochrome [Oceanibium sediminis]|uniref:c-type cytochrome n=1 Tax=Oceanibium sediminis TaxID=2026339 RepID=UPI00130054CA|nr:cytochrome c [Oceanibium sediminis]
MRLSTLGGAVMTLAVLGTTVGMAMAGGHTPVEQREAKMKAVGENTGIVGNMLRGKTDFDAEAANAALVAMREAAGGFNELFPEGTEGAGSNEFAAGPKIWSDRAGFDAEYAKFIGAIDAAVAAEPQDMAALGAAFGPIGQECKACHETYRMKK